MDTQIENRINLLKAEHNELIDLKEENKQLFDKLKAKIVQLQSWYNKYVAEHKDHLFIFGLDSFHYQGKIIDVEYEDMMRLYCSISNRMYCEYYKLYQIMIKYVMENVKDKKVIDIITSNNSFPMYKDLEPYKQYGSETISQLHDIVLLLFSGLKNVLDKKQEELRMHKAKNDIGLNIDNFIQTFQFDNTVLEQKLSLFISYMEFFHKMHIKYLKRFTSKMNLFSSQIDHDIKIDSTSRSKERRKSMIDEFKHDNIGATLMHQLTDSISGGGSDSDLATNSPSRSCESPDTKETEYASRNNSNEMNSISFVEGNEHGVMIKEPLSYPDVNEIERNTNELSEQIVHVEMDIEEADQQKDMIPPSSQEENEVAANNELNEETNQESETVMDDDSTFTEEDVRIRRRFSSTSNGQQIIHRRLCYKVVFSAGAYVREQPSYDKDVKKVGTIDMNDIVESNTKHPNEYVSQDNGETITWIKLVKPVEGWIPLVNQKGNKVIELVEEIPDIDKKSEIIEEEVKSVASQLLGSVIESALDNTAQPK
uniref:Uncharacterized protein n=1 Tax=viral metagenome TaxID=1070528 RepID=A0A6C0FAM9_9ZZZZ